MIVRSWRARAAKDKADSYVEHAQTRVFPQLRAIAGHRGALLLRGDREQETEVVVLTFWDSVDAIRAFAGADPEAAVVEPEAQAVLLDYDRRARHYEVAASSGIAVG